MSRHVALNRKMQEVDVVPFATRSHVEVRRGFCLTWEWQVQLNWHCCRTDELCGVGKPQQFRDRADAIKEQERLVKEYGATIRNNVNPKLDTDGVRS